MNEPCQLTCFTLGMLGSRLMFVWEPHLGKPNDCPDLLPEGYTLDTEAL